MSLRRRAPDFTPDEIERLAGTEHGRWNAERRRDGWRYGEQRDRIAPVSPYLVSWSKESGNIKMWDRKAVAELPVALRGIDVEVYRL